MNLHNMHGKGHNTKSKLLQNENVPRPACSTYEYRASTVGSTSTSDVYTPALCRFKLVLRARVEGCLILSLKLSDLVIGSAWELHAEGPFLTDEG
jgi:hypothetical protein